MVAIYFDGKTGTLTNTKDPSQSAIISQIGPQMTKLWGFEAAKRSKMANKPRRGFRCFIFGSEITWSPKLGDVNGEIFNSRPKYKGC
jgi:hypothetical protein